MGFAYRKLGDYPAALDAYGKALTLNPYNRGALEYLGEAYLELDRPDDAKATLDRLADACRRLAHAAVDPLATCAEWQELSEAYEAYLATTGARVRSRWRHGQQGSGTAGGRTSRISSYATFARRPCVSRSRTRS